MPSRLDRYGKVEQPQKRVSKNQDLYQDLKSYTNYKEVSNIEPVIAKETYSFEDIVEKPRRRAVIKETTKSPEKISSLLMIEENKEYDISKVLKEAKQTRSDKDELESKRSLKKKEYNIVNEIDIEKIDEIREKRKNTGVNVKEDDEIKELIDTIYSKKLKEELDARLNENKEDSDLFSDLLPKSNEETIIDEKLGEKIVQEAKIKHQKEKIENSFFTTSMELSTDDLEDEEEYDADESFLDDEKKLTIWSIVLIVLGVLIVVGGIICFLITSFN